MPEDKKNGKDEKLTAVCPACGRNHAPGSKLTEKEQAAHHKD